MTQRSARLADELVASGTLASEWRDAFASVPRHLFIPDAVWTETDRGLFPLCRSDDEAEWMRLAYADRPVIIQADDGRTRPGQRGLRITSSISQPSIVALVLGHLDVAPGARVLEIGTGSGYNAALLAHRLGDAAVVTIEIDAHLAEHARKALAEAGLHPEVIHGDGMTGFPPGAPYDRVMATCAVQRVPHAWIAQTRPGGRVVAPWGTAFHNGALACLTVVDDGIASGRFVEDVAFMWARDQRVPFGRISQFIHDEHAAHQSRTRLHPDTVAEFNAAFAIGTRLPDVLTRYVDADDDSGEFTLWLLHPDSGSWASIDYEPDATDYLVEQLGPRMLWNETEAAYRWWRDAGSPNYQRFGLTITPTNQTLWLNDPSTVIQPARGAVGRSEAF